VNRNSGKWLKLAVVALCGAAAAIWLLPLLGRAQEVPEITPLNLEPCPFKNGERLEYEFGWNGIPAGRAVTTVRQDTVNNTTVLRLRTETQTTGRVRMLWKMDDWAESIVHPQTMKPLGFIIHQEEAGIRSESAVEFNRGEKVAKINRIYKSDRKLKTVNFMDAYDPISLAFLLRCVKFKVGDKKVFELIDGNNTFRVTFDVVATEPISIALGNFAAYKLQPGFIEVPPPANPAPKILYRAYLWIDIEPPHRLLQVKSKIMVGNVYGELVKISSTDSGS